MLDKKRYLEELESLVNIDSGTYCKAGVDFVAEWFAQRFSAMGWKTEWFEPAPETLGKSVLCTPSAARNFDLLILCHIDTVFPAGEAERRPFSIEGDRLRGPGAADMKGGCLFALHALEQLVAEKGALGNVGVFFNGEHEISCPNTRAVIEDLSRGSKVIFATECVRANGAHIKQRKGILRYTLKFSGVSAHSGNNPQDGACAVTEMANWILFFKSLEDPGKGITVNPGMAHGGASVNTIPDEAELRVDIRTVDYEDSLAIDAAVRARGIFNPRVSFALGGGITRPPMKPNAATERICAVVDEVSLRHGITPKWAFVGGGSDASFASAMGKPALCGIGPVGGGAHTQNEFIDTTDLEARFAEFKDIVSTLSTLQSV
ncbi:M20 family metallopeptidase [Oleispirillum naphthae]|uniref:M20 family metallopeptidase n=1 Tax=Oleispirillum naphthae TaxID=2838853 RepID=UPI0030823D1A